MSAKAHHAQWSTGVRTLGSSLGQVCRPPFAISCWNVLAWPKWSTRTNARPPLPTRVFSRGGWLCATRCRMFRGDVSPGVLVHRRPRAPAAESPRLRTGACDVWTVLFFGVSVRLARVTAILWSFIVHCCCGSPLSCSCGRLRWCRCRAATAIPVAAPWRNCVTQGEAGVGGSTHHAISVCTRLQ